MREAECDIHLVPFDEAEGCRYCLRFLASPPDPELMAPAMRLEELEQWLTARRSVPEHLVYARIEQLLGRRLSIHELDNPDLLMRRAQRPRRDRFADYWFDP
jgi:hypothetical protein